MAPWTRRVSAECSNSSLSTRADLPSSLYSLQDNQSLLLTPFERNLEVWRQLWRTLERSDLVVQIVDARNPLSFRSEDLEKYVLELNTDDIEGTAEKIAEATGEEDASKVHFKPRPKRKNLLLINKSDLLTQKQRYVSAFASSPSFRKLILLHSQGGMGRLLRGQQDPVCVLLGRQRYRSARGACSSGGARSLGGGRSRAQPLELGRGGVGRGRGAR
jgi:hypothetical protein